MNLTEVGKGSTQLFFSFFALFSDETMSSKVYLCSFFYIALEKLSFFRNFDTLNQQSVIQLSVLTAYGGGLQPKDQYITMY
ncbi:hypothetical protein DP117_18810 [Brasilonema sp. UFV-L1]|nr:hypothetical protein [Brasilonema sp. UFV-L1]